jgi:uncharacterized protein (TIGR03118 family)
MQRHAICFSLAVGLLVTLVSGAALAQYELTVLDSNQFGKATHGDPLLANGWGMVHGPGTPWWVSDNASGWSTLYQGNGKQVQQLKVLIPTAGNGPDSPKGANGPGSPTGIVFNGTAKGSGEFQVEGWPAIFIFATLDGTISGWAPQSNGNQAIVAVDTSKNTSPSMYTGLAITNKASGNMLFAADMANNKVDVYDANFNPVTLAAGAFTDSAIPAGFAPFGIRDINSFVYVTFASVSGGAGGFVEKFTEDGIPVTPGKPLIHGAPLNQPWGIALAPRNFGRVSNTILIANNTNTGSINGFDPTMGTFVGSLKDTHGNPILINQLWAIDFGDGTGANGGVDQLFFTAGPDNNLAGEFGTILFK